MCIIYHETDMAIYWSRGHAGSQLWKAEVLRHGADIIGEIPLGQLRPKLRPDCQAARWTQTSEIESAMGAHR